MTWSKVDKPQEMQPPPKQEADTINPQHYRGGFRYRECECIDLARELPFSIGNAVKYIWRAGRKGDAKEDLKKALWYIEDARMNLRLTQEQTTRATIVDEMMRTMPDAELNVCMMKLNTFRFLARGKYNDAMLNVERLALAMGVILDD